MTISRSERLLAMAIAAVTLAMRAVAFFHYRFDSDEPQHLHVAWGWTAGLLQYRDVFDNHAPLFHMAMAPLLRALGERADILIYMRAPMLVLWVVVSVVTFAIARRLYDGRIAMWSVLLLNVLPPFFLKSIEFRTDNLWDAFWMLAVAVLVLPRRASRRSGAAFFVAGLLLGGALGVSLKTALLFITLAGAAVVTYAMRKRDERLDIGPRHIIALAAGIVIVPSIIAWYFVSRGAWSNFVDCAFRFNALVALTRSPIVVWTPRLLFVPLMIVALRVAWRHRQTTTNARFFFALATAIFFITLCGFWILISPRDFLPFLPFASMFAVAALARHPHFERNLAALMLVCLIGVGYYAQWLTNRTREFITMERQVLNLTRPGEPVMDYKGETIYRRRPSYYILEFITRNAIVRGLIPDTVPEDLVRAGCHVAQADGSQWPDRARSFMDANFLNLGRLRASGQWIAPDGSFSIAIPGKYVIIGAGGSPRGLLDGTPYREARQLAAGVHTFKFEIGGPDERLACLWAPAWWRGFSPFHHRDLDF
jgi:4-amino-4-deoxy-L-arabinose transferase-like glycosyltransferase